MLTINTILKELRNVPVDRLEDLYAIIHSLRANTKKHKGAKNEILAFAGSFSDLSEKDFNDLQQHSREARNDLFSREADL